MAEDSYNSTKWIEEIRLVLLRAQLTSRQLQQVEELLCRLQADNAHKVRQEENEKHNKLNHIREQELLAEALVREEKFRAQIQEAEEDIRSKQIHLEQVTLQLRQQHDEVLNRLNRVQVHADEVKRQENDLVKREKDLEKKQGVLEEEHRTLAGLRAELQEAAHSLRKEHSDTKTILELKSLQDRCLHLELELKEAKNQLIVTSVNKTEMGVQVSDILCSRIPDSHIGPPPEGNIDQHESHHSSGSSSCSSVDQTKGKRNNQISLLKRVLSRVQLENSELKAIAAQQRKRIDELTTRATQLANHIAEQAELSSHQAPQTVLGPAVTQLPQHPPPVPPRDCHVETQLGFREPGQNFSSHAAPSPRNQGRDWRRRPLKRVIKHASFSTSFSSDESPTEEVLKEARNRLRRLEEESEAVDRSYRDFQARQASSASMLFVPTEQSLVNTQMDFTYRNNYPVEPPLLHSSSYSSPAGAQFRSFTVPTARTMPKTSSGLVSGFSASPRSQFTFPERPSYSPLRNNVPSRVTDPVISLPHRSTGFKRPSDRLKSLFENRPNFMKYSVKEAEYPTNETKTVSERKLSSPLLGQSQEHVFLQQNTQSNIHADNSDIQDVAQEFQEMDMGPSSPVEMSHEVLADRQSDKIEESGTSAGGLVSKHIPEPPSAFEEASKKSVIEEIRPTPSGTTEKPASSIALINDRERSISLQNIRESLPLAVTKPAVQPPNLEHSVQGHAIKTNLMDTTLNEISTLSSSPAISSDNAGSVKTKAAHDADVEIEKSIQEYGVHLSHPLPPEAANGNLVPSPKLEHSTQQSPKYEGDSVPGKASHLLNTSLSSIENGDQHVSAGSEGKKTEDDDDFW